MEFEGVNFCKAPDLSERSNFKCLYFKMMKMEMVTSSTEVFKLIKIACLFIEPDEKGVKVFLVEIWKIAICSKNNFNVACN